MFNPLIIDNSGLKNIEEHTAERQIARKLFEKALRRGFTRRVQGLITRQQRQIIPLTLCLETAVAHGGHHEGVQTVSLDQIQGSENRIHDFDIEFNPLTDRIEERWINVAAAKMNGIEFAPVELVRIGETYLVRDGHHRISVARAMGDVFIEAIVVSLDAVGC